MTALREAAQQALEAFYEETAWFGPTPKGAAAINALRAALAEPPTNQCGETCQRARLCAACAGELAKHEPVATRRLTDDQIGRIWFRLALPGVTETQARLIIREAEKTLMEKYPCQT